MVFPFFGLGFRLAGRGSKSLSIRAFRRFSPITTIMQDDRGEARLIWNTNQSAATSLAIHGKAARRPRSRGVLRGPAFGIRLVACSAEGPRRVHRAEAEVETERLIRPARGFSPDRRMPLPLTDGRTAFVAARRRIRRRRSGGRERDCSGGSAGHYHGGDEVAKLSSHDAVPFLDLTFGWHSKLKAFITSAFHLLLPYDSRVGPGIARVTRLILNAKLLKRVRSWLLRRDGQENRESRSPRPGLGSDSSVVGFRDRTHDRQAKTSGAGFS